MTDSTNPEPTTNEEAYLLVAEYSSREDFDLAMQVLSKAHFTAEEVSTALYAADVEGTSIEEDQHNHGSSPPPEKTTAAMTLAGGTLGAALGTATMIGPMLVAGPLFGMAAGAIGGSVLSSMQSHGGERENSESFEDRVRNGSSLIIISGDEIRLQSAKRILKTTDHRSIEEFPKA